MVGPLAPTRWAPSGQHNSSCRAIYLGWFFKLYHQLPFFISNPFVRPPVRVTIARRLLPSLANRQFTKPGANAIINKPYCAVMFYPPKAGWHARREMRHPTPSHPTKRTALFVLLPPKNLCQRHMRSTTLSFLASRSGDAQDCCEIGNACQRICILNLAVKL